jgi:hypothetical protein
MSMVRVSLWGGLACLVLAMACAPARAQTGLRIEPDAGAQHTPWPRWQARIGLSTRTSAVDSGAAWQVSAGQMLGDYYLGAMRLGASGSIGGFRATGGLLIGQRALALGTPALSAWQGSSLTVLRSLRPANGTLAEGAQEPWSAAPYIGVGYSGVSLRGGWGFTADVGLTAGANGLRARRDGALGSQGLDDLLRELRLRPVLQVGASYAF